MHFLIIAFAYIITLTPQTGQSLPKKALLGYNILEMPPPNKYELPGTMRFPEIFFHNAIYRPPINIKGIQYAPLHASIKERKLNTNINNGSATAFVLVKNATITSHREKEHLEPRDKQTKENENNQIKNCYNIKLTPDVLTSVSRSPGHNAIYRSFQQILPRDKFANSNKQRKKQQEPMAPPKKALRKINYLRPYGIYRAIQVGDISKWPVDLTSKIKPEMSVANKKFVFNDDEINRGFESIISNSKQQTSEPFNKYYTNRLHLNIAKLYSTGAQQEAQLYTDEHPSKYDKAPSKTLNMEPNSVRVMLYKAMY